MADFGNARFVPEVASPSIQEPDSSRTLIPGSPTQQNSQSLKDGLGKGTLAYTAPEIFENKDYTFSVDIYSLGITLHALFTSQEPFQRAKTNIQIMMGIKRGFFESGMQGEWSGAFPNGEQVDADIFVLVQDMISRDPLSRPTASDIQLRLQHFD